MTRLFELDAQRREVLLNAALKEFSRKGYDNASTNIIAKEAGISKALMFHYIGSKQELFFIVYDYFNDLMEKEYFGIMDYNEKDIFNRLHQSYVLQLELIKKYPWITEFSSLSHPAESPEVNAWLENKIKHADCYPDLFENIDEYKFRKGLDINKCKKFIFWANIGFTNELLSEIRNNDKPANYENIMESLNGYFEELRKIFYSVD